MCRLRLNCHRVGLRLCSLGLDFDRFVLDLPPSDLIYKLRIDLCNVERGFSFCYLVFINLLGIGQPNGIREVNQVHEGIIGPLIGGPNPWVHTLGICNVSFQLAANASRAAFPARCRNLRVAIGDTLPLRLLGFRPGCPHPTEIFMRGHALLLIE
jgi:hypothetical protein